MFLRGINYDIGTSFHKGTLSRPDFDEAQIEKEIDIIRNVLKCDCIRISGLDTSRLIKASEFALQKGLRVWISPAPIDFTQEEALNYLIACAEEAEKLRQKYSNIIFVVGCEYSLFLKGFLKGESIYDRLKRMFNPFGIILNLIGLRNSVYKRLNTYLAEVTTHVRTHFNGPLTYASGTWEKIDWNLFEYVGIDHYRASYNRSFYLKQLRSYYRFNKPVVVLEFGCCTYKGAEEKGGAGWAITEIKDGKPVIKEGYIRDETVQANYIVELLDIFKQEDVFAAFVFTFSNPVYKYNSDPRLDLDMASYGIVKSVEKGNMDSYQGMPWVPKEAFYKFVDYDPLR